MPGSPTPLGARWDGTGVNFALFSASAESVELCLFEQADATKEFARLTLPERSGDVWHGYVPGLFPGQAYGYRVNGRNAPEEGQRFNPHKLLIDPYARAIAGRLQWSNAPFGYEVGGEPDDTRLSTVDSAADIPKCLVIDDAFPWDNDRRPGTPWTQTVIYECHVKAMTALHPGVPEALRGTYLGMASDPIIDHLRSLGVTAVELLPVHHMLVERHLVERGLTNYWGYDPIGFFAPDPRFATRSHGEQVHEFKAMVKALHAAGIEVILDVVYNHTGEGNELGPTICFRGIDNPSYYRLVHEEPRYYVDTTGCGNTVDLSHPFVLQLVLDSLRYWAEEMHVDGFRFDLAVTLGRDPWDFHSAARFFVAVQQDPVLSQLKLIAEPWDLGPDGYRLGGFPVGWNEWNGRFRDTTRRFWRGDEGQLADLASRLSGSSDLFEGSRRRPQASVNFVTCHDGFTLRDLVSYEQKHNLANGWDNTDGTDSNWSRNWGAEGETESVPIRRNRLRAMRSMMATLAFSQGVPMLSHGDEIGRTQRGNNNSYCQDNEISWLDWDLDEEARDFLDFTRRVLDIRRNNPVFRRRRFFSGETLSKSDHKDVSWLHPEGREMQGADWADPQARTLGLLIPGEASDAFDERGRPTTGYTLMLLVNGSPRSRFFRLPPEVSQGVWREVLNTAVQHQRLVRGGGVKINSHSLVLIRREDAR